MSDESSTISAGREPALAQEGEAAGVPRAESPRTRQTPPLITIKSTGRWRGLQLRELWAHRDLFFFLAWRDVKVRYQQTILGVAWAVLQPFLTMVVFTFLFGRLAHVPSEGVPYAIFSYAALVPWNFFNLAVGNAGNSLVSNANLITKVYFPRMVIPLAAVGAALVDFAIASSILLLMMPWYGVAFSWSLLMYPILGILTAIVAAGIGMWLAALNVKYRDIRYALPFLLQLWMFVTPVIYPVSFLPAGWRWLLRLNPLSGIIEGFRDAIFARPFGWSGLAWSAMLAGLAMVFAAYAFRRMEAGFADVI